VSDENKKSPQLLGAYGQEEYKLSRFTIQFEEWMLQQ
jgi:hypothetical protein